MEDLLILDGLDEEVVTEALRRVVPYTAKDVKATVYVARTSGYRGKTAGFDLPLNSGSIPVELTYEHDPDKEPRTMHVACTMPTFMVLVPITIAVDKESLQSHYLPYGYFANSVIEGSYEVTSDGVGTDQHGAGSCRVTDQGLLIYASLIRPAGLQFYEDLKRKYRTAQFHEVK